MHSHIFNPQPTCPLDGQQYLVLHMPAWPFSGLAVRQIILQYCLHPTYGATAICSMGLFYDTRCTPNTLAFWRKTWWMCYGLESSPFSFFLSYVFWRSLQSCRKSFWFFSDVFQKGAEEISANVLNFFVPSDLFWGSLILLLDCSIITPTSGSVFSGIFVPFVPSISRGFSKVLESTAPQLWETSQEVFTVSSVSPISW